MKFNFETIVYKNSSANEILSKKYAIFFTFHGQNDANGFEWFKNLTSFLTMKRKNMAYFLIKFRAHSSSSYQLFHN